MESTTTAPRPRCDATGKRKFGSKTEARAANQCNSKRIRVYRCDECHGWHISQETNWRRNA